GVDPIQAVSVLLHGSDAVMNFLARTVGDVEEHAGCVCDTLDGGDHFIDGGGSLADTRGLYLSVLDHVLHVDAHLVHGAGHFINGGRGLQTDLGGFIGCAGDLSGAAGNLGAAVTHIAYDGAKAVHHAGKGMADGVTFGTRVDLHHQIPAGYGLRNASHLAQVFHHGVETARELTDFVAASDIDFVFQVAAVADSARDAHQIRERLRNGCGGGVGDDESEDDGNEGTNDGNGGSDLVGTFVGFAAGIKNLPSFAVRFVEHGTGITNPGGCILLQIEDLE